MVLRAETVFRKMPQSNTGVIYIPAQMVTDSQFPFTPSQKIRIRIEGKNLIITT